MKILFIAELRIHARSKQRLLALRDLGYEVKEVSTIPDENYSRNPNIFERISFKLGYPVDLVDLNNRLCEYAINFSPDLIWVEKVLTIQPDVYQKLRKSLPNTKIVFYSEDDIFMRHNRSVFLRKSLPIFDLVFTTKPRNLQELPQLGAKKVFCIYQAYDLNVHRPISVTPTEQEKWGGDVSFVGTFERDRAEKMLYVAKQGILVRVWGSNWQVWKNEHPNLQIMRRAIYNEEFIKVLCSSKINLNFLRKVNRDLHTSRSLEIPACGAFMLTERTKEHQELFTEGKEAAFFETPSELVEKIRYYLSHEEERSQVAQSGRIRCLSGGYSHNERLKVMLDRVYEL
jgi:spore maturation protein CgeB